MPLLTTGAFFMPAKDGLGLVIYLSTLPKQTYTIFDVPSRGNAQS